ncbi:olfactory receptor 12D1-like [Chelonoidis abingdonii]|uniref:G-protein coupled receptors family 1 profile domain-containing protein n=1 Tax=Chelonoidis abingdonii TaxID=106734 RepID=A0A8C0GGE7_CHEAB|nr:olfactory receptor 12D2-like [Chelonoidis abingdonii]
MENQTDVSKFFFLGITNLRSLQCFLFPLFLLLYMASVLGNGVIVAVLLAEPQLHTPMYFFLGNLSILDIFYSTVTVPKMLAGFLSGHQTISFSSCLAQLHFFHFLGSSEAMLLAVMAYNHYVAICNPLLYTLVMSPQACLLLVGVTWATGFLHALMHTVMTSRLHFCGPNHIHHFFCDIKPLLSLACSSTHLNLSLLHTVTGIIGVSPFIITLLSYLYIISFLFLKVRSRESRRKAFSTCTSHLTMIALYYGTVIFAYKHPSSGSSKKEEMIITLVYSVITPALNPLIYTLRNSEVKYATRKFITRKLFPERN